MIWLQVSKLREHVKRKHPEAMGDDVSLWSVRIFTYLFSPSKYLSFSISINYFSINLSYVVIFWCVLICPLLVGFVVWAKEAAKSSKAAQEAAKCRKTG